MKILLILSQISLIVSQIPTIKHNKKAKISSTSSQDDQEIIEKAIQIKVPLENPNCPKNGNIFIEEPTEEIYKKFDKMHELFVEYFETEQENKLKYQNANALNNSQPDILVTYGRSEIYDYYCTHFHINVYVFLNVRRFKNQKGESGIQINKFSNVEERQGIIQEVSTLVTKKLKKKILPQQSLTDDWEIKLWSPKKATTTASPTTSSTVSTTEAPTTRAPTTSSKVKSTTSAITTTRRTTATSTTQQTTTTFYNISDIKNFKISDNLLKKSENETTLEKLPASLTNYFEQEQEKINSTEALSIFKDLNTQLQSSSTKISKQVITEVLGWTETLKNKKLNVEESGSLRDELSSMSSKISTQNSEIVKSQSFGVANLDAKEFTSVVAKSGGKFEVGYEDDGKSDIGGFRVWEITRDLWFYAFYEKIEGFEFSRKNGGLHF